jgi:Flp pilus assembly protein TadD
LQRRISENAVLAQYYNNLGADALTNEDLAGAYAYFTKAIQTEPDLHYLWSNLGVVYSRNEQLMDAKQAYLTALGIDSSSTMAANNLYLIYEKTGDLAGANELQKRVEKNRRKNPYYLANLSAGALEEGRVADSKDLLLKALDLHENEYRFHYDLARILVLEGDHEKALVSLQRALELAPKDFQVSVTQLYNLPDLNQEESD